jgi:hypothetical protein
MYVHATVSTVFLVFLPIVMALGASGRAAAESLCVEQPGQDAPHGEHWYYHYDSQRNRKCWHLGSVIAAAAVPPPRSERPRAASSSVNAVFAPFLEELRNLFRQPMPHEPAAGEPRIVQSDATRLLTIDDIAQQPEFPEERAEPRPVLLLTATQRKALYEEYLKWEALRRSDAGTPAPAN